MDEALNATAPRLCAETKIAKTQKTLKTPTTAWFLVKQFKEFDCGKLTSAVRTPGSSYSYSRMVFRTAVAAFDGLLQ